MLNIRTLVVSTLVLGGAATAAVFSPFAQEEPEMQMPEPTDQHKMLMKAAGEWEGTISMKMPDGSEGKTPCSETITKLGDLWTKSDFTMEYEGMPFEGHSILGYQTADDKLVGTWIDAWTPYLAVMEGEMDLEAGTTEMKWIAPAQGMGELTPHRMVTEWKEDSYTSNFFMGEGDAEVPTMTIEMKRKK